MGKAAFARRARLTTGGDYRRVFRESVRSSDAGLSVLAVRNELGYPRLGLAVSRRYAKTAILRNRIKRIARESFRLNQDRLGSLDVVVLAKAGVERLSAKDLRTVLERHWTNVVARCESC